MIEGADMECPAGDGRRPLRQLYRAFLSLEEHGWIAETVAQSAGEYAGKPLMAPVMSFRTKKKGKAAWLIAGIHGEEPAGPNALAEGIRFIRALGARMPVVLLPLCNPLGYARNWRYLDAATWTQGGEGCSIGDSEHVLPGLKNPEIPRAARASSPEAQALVAHVLNMAADYPPAFSVDLHEDSLIDEGYVYSQGTRGSDDAIARTIVGLLSASGIPIKMSGWTRFNEEIKEGIVVSDRDGSIDELLASEKIIVDGRSTAGPGAATVIVVETPATALPLETRKNAHLAILKSLADL